MNSQVNYLIQVCNDNKLNDMQLQSIYWITLSQHGFGATIEIYRYRDNVMFCNGEYSNAVFGLPRSDRANML